MEDTHEKLLLLQVSSYPQILKQESKSTTIREHSQIRKTNKGFPVVVQWLGTCLPMQGTRVQALVREDPTCRRATKPMRYNY